MGKHGSIQVEVITKNGAIERIDVLDSRESAGLGDVCMDKLGKLIVEGQTLNVDVVSGASLSSMAYLTAVAEALDKAGEKSSEWKKRDKALQRPDNDIPTSYDVVIVGAGGAGFTAAISAANKGKKVLLMEKLGVFGGSTALSGGEMAVPGNWIQKNSGLEDSPELLAADMLEGGDHRGDPGAGQRHRPRRVRCRRQWLTYEGGVSWEHNLLFFGGHTVKRSIIPSGHIGNAMTTRLTTRARSVDNITLIDNTKATDLAQDSDGKINGIKAVNVVTGDEYAFDCKAVVLSCGGFGANVEMRAKANPEFGEQFNSTDSVGAQGDGLTMASAIGADLVDMELIQTIPSATSIPARCSTWTTCVSMSARSCSTRKANASSRSWTSRRAIESYPRANRRARLRNMGSSRRRRDQGGRYTFRRVREPRIAQAMREGRYARGGMRAFRHRCSPAFENHRAVERIRRRRI